MHARSSVLEPGVCLLHPWFVSAPIAGWSRKTKKDTSSTTKIEWSECLLAWCFITQARGVALAGQGISVHSKPFFYLVVRKCMVYVHVFIEVSHTYVKICIYIVFLKKTCFFFFLFSHGMHHHSLARITFKIPSLGKRGITFIGSIQMKAAAIRSWWSQVVARTWRNWRCWTGAPTHNTEIVLQYLQNSYAGHSLIHTTRLSDLTACKLRLLPGLLHAFPIHHNLAMISYHMT
jgi:hypothetical protein